jgi:hypothetical protein
MIAVLLLCFLIGRCALTEFDDVASLKHSHSFEFDTSHISSSKEQQLHKNNDDDQFESTLVNHGTRIFPKFQHDLFKKDISNFFFVFFIEYLIFFHHCAFERDLLSLLRRMAPFVDSHFHFELSSRFDHHTPQQFETDFVLLKVV